MAPINVTTSRQQIQASVAEDKISANVSAGFGAAGPAATITVGTVTTGAPGSSASVVNVGTSSAAVLDFTIPAGATGAAGPAGANGQPGATGPAGAAATVSVGTVTTGAAGSSASVTNVGSSSAAVLNFTIPAGATGPQGPAGATGPAGTTTWAGITDKPSFAAVATSGSASDLSAGTLNASRLPATVVRTGSVVGGTVYVNALECSPTPAPETPGDVALFRGYDGVDVTSAIYADGQIICGAIKINGVDLDTTLSGKAAASHAHGSITSAGAIGTTSGLVVTTGSGGVLGTLAQGTAGQVLKVNSGATGVEWGAAAADVSIDTTAADILSASSGSITADDPGADRLVFWDDSAGKLTYLSAGTNITITDTTISAAGSTSASDLTSGTLAYARMADPTVTSPSQITASQNDYASFARGINRFTTNGAYNLTGMVAGNDGEVRVLCNTGTTAANTLTIKDESSSSTASNRFYVPWNGDCVIPAEGSVVVFYDGTSSRWRVV